MSNIQTSRYNDQRSYVYNTAFARYFDNNDAHETRTGGIMTDHRKTCETISKLIGKDLTKAYVRLEVICDRAGFWLKPHCDIKEKILSCLLFVNKHNESEDLGTDFYDSNLKRVKTLPYRDNYGYFFSSGPNTWHGMEKKEIIKERRCLQVNYVTFKTDWKVED